MTIDKLKTKFFTGAWLTDVKHYFSKINEIIDYLNGTSGEGSYKSYIALLSQTGTSDPIVTILENNIGNIIWTRSAVGQYDATLINSFPDGKTGVITSDQSNDGFNLVGVEFMEVMIF